MNTEQIIKIIEEEFGWTGESTHYSREVAEVVEHCIEIFRKEERERAQKIINGIPDECEADIETCTEILREWKQEALKKLNSNS